MHTNEINEWIEEEFLDEESIFHFLDLVFEKIRKIFKYSYNDWSNRKRLLGMIQAEYANSKHDINDVFFLCDESNNPPNSKHINISCYFFGMLDDIKVYKTEL